MLPTRYNLEAGDGKYHARGFHSPAFKSCCLIVLGGTVLTGGSEPIVVRSLPHVVVGQSRAPFFSLEQVPSCLGGLAASGGR